MTTEPHPEESSAIGEATAQPGCADAVAQLFEYLDGELDTETVARIETHLRDCSPCLETFDFHVELRHVIRSKCAESMPQDVRSKLLAMFADPPT